MSLAASGTPLQNLVHRGHRSTMISALRMTDEIDAGPVVRQADARPVRHRRGGLPAGRRARRLDDRGDRRHRARAGPPGRRGRCLPAAEAGREPPPGVRRPRRHPPLRADAGRRRLPACVRRPRPYRLAPRRAATTSGSRPTSASRSGTRGGKRPCPGRPPGPRGPRVRQHDRPHGRGGRHGPDRHPGRRKHVETGAPGRRRPAEVEALRSQSHRAAPSSAPARSSTSGCRTTASTASTSST